MIDTKEHILKAAYLLFLAKNYEAVTMSELSKATGLTKGAIYHHFINKEDLFKAVIDRFMVETRIRIEYDGCKLHEFIDLTLKMANEQMNIFFTNAPDAMPRHHISLLIEAHQYYPEYAEIGRQFFKNDIEKWKLVLRDAVDRHEIRDSIDIDTMALNFLMLGTSIITNLLITGSIEFASNAMRLQLQELYNAIKI